MAGVGYHEVGDHDLGGGQSNHLRQVEGLLNSYFVSP